MRFDSEMMEEVKKLAGGDVELEKIFKDTIQQVIFMRNKNRIKEFLDESTADSKLDTLLVYILADVLKNIFIGFKEVYKENEGKETLSSRLLVQKSIAQLRNVATEMELIASNAAEQIKKKDKENVG